jgi:L-rhamnose-H+ transport protein
MSSHALEALLLIFVAALMNATYTLPMKLHRRWAWEHSWLAFTVLGVMLVPATLALVTVPALVTIYTEIPWQTLAAMSLFGAGWGVSLIFFGLAISMVGIAVTFAVCLGTSAASGALIPLFAQHSDKLASREGMLVLAGIVAILFGVALCGIANQLRDRAASASKSHASPAKGFVYAFMAGALGSLFNLGLAFGGEIQKAAQARGASDTMMFNAVWLPCIVAGFVPGVIYCLYLMRKNRNTSEFVANSRWYYWPASALMGALWYGSIMLYSVSSMLLGELGAAIGWPLFLSSIVIASTVTGLLAGEWSGAGKRPLHVMFGGVGSLLAAIAILSQASR